MSFRNKKKQAPYDEDYTFYRDLEDGSGSDGTNPDDKVLESITG